MASRKTKVTKQFTKAYQKCKQSGFDMKSLDSWIEILGKRDLTDAEKEQTNWHGLHKDKYYPDNCYALHVLSRRSNWELIYQQKDDGGIVLITFLNTGNHNQIYKSRY